MNAGPAIILLIVAAIVGYLIGLFDSRLTASLRKKTKKGAVPEPAAEPATEELNRFGERTVLKVTVNPALKLHLELDGTRLKEPGEISPDQRQRIVDLIVKMRPWLEGTPVPSEPAVVKTQVARPAPEITFQKPAQAQTAPAAQQLRIDPIRGLRSMLTSDVKSSGEILRSQSIVEMIDEVLQARLPGTPLAGKSIRLEEGSMGELNVIVGSHIYPGIDAVPQPEIRAVIRDAIAEWEKK